MNFVYWPLMGGLLHLVQRGGDWAGPLAVPNVTGHPSTAIVSITVLLYSGPLLCGFNVRSTGLILSYTVSGLAHTFCAKSQFVFSRKRHLKNAPKLYNNADKNAYTL